MIDPTRYIRKAVVNALAGVVTVYDRPPGSATTPYAVIGVTVQQLPVKTSKFYRASIIITIYNEFREYAGRKSVDEITDGILGIMVPNNYAYLSIENFNHASCKLVSTDENSNMQDSITSTIKALRFESLINE